MPTYDYRCKSCGHELEVHQGFDDDPLTQCPACGADSLRKRFAPVGIAFKGSGFYKTDSRKSSGSSSSSRTSGTSAASGTESTASGTDAGKEAGREAGKEAKASTGDKPKPAASGSGSGSGSSSSPS
jgi:putative FmdB family regulatory protein